MFSDEKQEVSVFRECCSDFPTYIREEDDAGEDEPRSDPVERSEGVGEVPNGEEKADELPGGENQAGRQAGALRG